MELTKLQKAILESLLNLKIKQLNEIRTQAEKDGAVLGLNSELILDECEEILKKLKTN